MVARPTEPVGIASPIEDARSLLAPLPGRGRMVLRRFRRKRVATASLALLVLLLVLAFAGPTISPWDYRSKDFDAFLQPPSSRHWFGTTQIGQDVFALTLRGLQKSLAIGFLVAFISTAVAAIVGSCAGYYGSRVDRSLMWLVDLAMTLPHILIIAIVSPRLRGQSWLLLVILLAAFWWLLTARMVRGMALVLRNQDFVRAAQYMGVPSFVIIVRHLLPNMSSLLVIDGTISVGAAILAESSLSYLGFGVQPPDVSLGTLISDGTRSALTHPWLFAFSGGALVLTVLATSAVGEGLRDALDPHSSDLRDS